MADRELMELAKELGYKGDEIRAYVKEQQDLLREERLAQREAKKREDEAEQKRREDEAEQKRREDEMKRFELETEAKKESESKQLEVKRLEAEQRQAEIQVEKLKIEAALRQQDAELKLKYLDREQESKRNADRELRQIEDRRVHTPRLPLFDSSKDEMDTYLQRFERYAEVNGWKRESWAFNLSNLLSGDAVKVYNSLPLDHATDYEKLKTALLSRYELTEDRLRQKFRCSPPYVGETIVQYTYRLSNYLNRWIELSKTPCTFKGLFDLIVKDQFLSLCTTDLVVFLLEHKEKANVLDSMSQLADHYRIAHAVPINDLIGCSNAGNKGRVVSAPRNSTANVQRNNGPTSPQNPRPFQYMNVSPPRPSRGPDIKCFRCNRVGHVAAKCYTPLSRDQMLSRNRPYGAPGSPPHSPTPQRVQFKDTSPSSPSRYPNRDETRVCNVCIPISHVITYSNAGSTVCVSSPSKSVEPNLPICEGLLDGQVVRVLRDTGCTSIIVKKSLVSPSQMTGKQMQIRMLCGYIMSGSVMKNHTLCYD